MNAPAHQDVIRPSTAIPALLGMLLGPGRGVLHLEFRSGGFGFERTMLRRIEPGWIPAPQVPFLEAGAGLRWHHRVSPSVRDEAGTPIRLYALFARFLTPATFGVSDWERNVEAQGVVWTRLQAFSLRPSAVVDGFHEITAFWWLTEALDLGTSAGYAAALDLQLQLAVCVGACADVIQERQPGAVREIAGHDPAGFAPLAGVVLDLGDRGAPQDVRIVHVDPTLSYTRRQIDAALQGARR